MFYKDIPDIPMQIVSSLEKRNISEMTEIQMQSFKHIIRGRDVIACSKTGSGKTLAYLIPIMMRLSPDIHHIQALILVPTGELAVQVNEQLNLLFAYEHCPFQSQFVIGERNLNRQIDSLKLKPAVLVGTPSRVLQLMSMKKLKVHEVKSFVLDEADRLLDKTFNEQVKSIRKALMKQTQVLLFSASIDKKTRKEAENLTFKAVDINIDALKHAKSAIPATIKHIYIVCERRERIETLRKIVRAVKPEKCLIFINTNYDLEESMQKLVYHHYNVGALSGNQDKLQKKNTLDKFKKGDIQLLLATDLAARGLQIDQIDTVINVNLPQEPKEYLHRAGRCGRNGNEGVTISIITENELNKIKRYQKDFHINMIARKLYQGRLVAK